MKCLNEFIVVASRDGSEWLQCRCGRSLCKTSENLKEHVKAKEFPIQRAGPHVVPIPVTMSHLFVWREFYCPACGLLLNTEVAQHGEPYFFDAQIF
jgi:acetone carboxylase gamma subunit